jgi:hypothetical protein
MSKERPLMILRNIKTLLTHLEKEIDEELKFEHILIHSMKTNLNCINDLLEEAQ